MTREYGSSGRTFKSALIWCVGDAPGSLREEAKKVLAWKAIREEEEADRFDEAQNRQVAESLTKAERNLREAKPEVRRPKPSFARGCRPRGGADQ
jgi:hypothetical protein